MRARIAASTGSAETAGWAALRRRRSGCSSTGEASPGRPRGNRLRVLVLRRRDGRRGPLAGDPAVGTVPATRSSTGGRRSRRAASDRCCRTRTPSSRRRPGGGTAGRSGRSAARTGSPPARAGGRRHRAACAAAAPRGRSGRRRAAARSRSRRRSAARRGRGCALGCHGRPRGSRRSRSERDTSPMIPPASFALVCQSPPGQPTRMSTRTSSFTPPPLKAYHEDVRGSPSVPLAFIHTSPPFVKAHDRRP